MVSSPLSHGCRTSHLFDRHVRCTMVRNQNESALHHVQVVASGGFLMLPVHGHCPSFSSGTAI